MSEKRENPFDLEATYDAEIAPLMAQIIDVCKRTGMPMVASFCYEGDPDGTGTGEESYCTTYLPRLTRDDQWEPKTFRRARTELLRREPAIVAAITVTRG